LDDFWKRFIDNHCHANHHKQSGINSKQYHYRQYLSPVLGQVRLDRITDEKLSELKAYMNTQLGGKPNKFSKPRKAAGTINNCLASLSKCLGCAVQWKVIPALPCEIEFLRRPVVAPKFYDFDVYEELVAAAKALDHRAYRGVARRRRRASSGRGPCA
jgi:hypothetical protein